MRALILIAATSALATSVQLQADVLAIKVGADAWNLDSTVQKHPNGDKFDLDNEWVGSFYIALEHPIPLLPNLKLRYNDVNINSGLDEADFSNLDYLGYYELLDNPLGALDLGLGIKQITSGKVNAKEFEDYIPTFYGAAEVDIPITGIAVYGDASYGRWDRDEAFDVQLGAKYTFDLPLLDLGLKGGYRKLRFDFENFDGYRGENNFNGWYLGTELTF